MLQKQNYPKKWTEDLVKDIRTNTEKDDICDPLGFGFPLDEFLRRPKTGQEFSLENHIALQEAINSCQSKPKYFLEIGVSRNGLSSSTHTILKNIPDDGIFLGVDIEDKSHLNNNEKGIYTIKENSSNYEKIIEKLKLLGVEELDFILIDSKHSINQVLDDWEYTRLLKKGGVVAFHDITAHPGPYYFIHNINTNKWIVSKNLCPDDYGFGYCILK
jgi:predicted O-methyltransferase YrrM